MKNETAKRELMNEFPNVMIKASAGTGKTFALSNRYLRLLASGAESQSILATTFTKKGAGEILDRIIRRLADGALDEKKSEKLSKELSWNLSQKRAGEILLGLLQNLHRLEVGTLDSFFSRIAKVFSMELGLPPTWDIVEEQEMSRLYDASVSDVLKSESAIELINLMGKGEASRRVATSLRETVDQVYRIYRESGDEPWNQIKRTSQFLSDNELEVLLQQMQSLELEQKRLREHWQEVVLDTALRNDWEAFIKATPFQNFLDGNPRYYNSKLPQSVLDLYERILPHCRAYVEEVVIRQNSATRSLLEKFDGYLQQAQSRTGKLRFDDVTNRLQDFIERWDSERCSFRLDQQIHHLLLDEFQDTSLGQWRVLRPFAQAVTANREDLKSFFCVGDMKQAIFGWRGGIAEIFDLVAQQLDSLKHDPLTTSYRSAQPIIDLVNNIFLNVDQYRIGDPVIESAIGDWKNRFSEHSTNLTEAQGYVTIEKARHEIDRHPDEGERDRRANDRIAERTIERVTELVNSLPDDKSIGVIVRTNAEVAGLIAGLQAHGIQASEEAGSALTDSAAVDLILSALVLADHPGDSFARFHVANSPLATPLGLVPENDSNQKEVAQLAFASSENIRSRLMLEGYGSVIESLARHLIPFCTKRELSRLQQLVQVAYTRSTNQSLWEFRPKSFVDFVRDEFRVTDPSGAQVRVMTIHKAKGLEFDVVVFPIPQRSASWGGMPPTVVVGRETSTSPINFVSRHVGKELRKLLPESVQNVFEADLQREVREAMCVLYVALTRAAHACHIILTSNAKVDHKSAAGLLLATVCPDAGKDSETEKDQEFLYEHGNRQWFLKKDDSGNHGTDREFPPEGDPEPESDPWLTPFFLPASAELRPRPISNLIRSGRGHVPVAHESLAGGNKISIRQLMPAYSNELREQRTLLRQCFDKVIWLDYHTPETAELEVWLKSLFPHEEVGVHVENFYRAIKNPKIKELLSIGSYQENHLAQFSPMDSLGIDPNRLEVKTGIGFSLSWEGTIYEGIIDRLVLIYQGDKLVGADLIDYKVAKEGLDTLPATIDFYRRQIQVYRQAASEMFQLPPERIATRIAYLATGQVINIDVVENSCDDESLSAWQRARRARPPAPKFIQNMDVQSEPVNSKPANASIGQSHPQKATESANKPRPKKRPDSSNQRRLWDDV